MKGPQITGILFGIFLLISPCLYVTGYGADLAGMAIFNDQEPNGVFDPGQVVDAPDYNNVEGQRKNGPSNPQCLRRSNSGDLQRYLRQKRRLSNWSSL